MQSSVKIMLRPWSDRSYEWFEECSQAFREGKGWGRRKWLFLKVMLWSEGSDLFLCTSSLLSSFPLPLPPLLSLSSPSPLPLFLTPPHLFSSSFLHFPVKFYTEESYIVGLVLCSVELGIVPDMGTLLPLAGWIEKLL